jgi:glycine betaine/proline transport system permease protein
MAIPGIREGTGLREREAGAHAGRSVVAPSRTPRWRNRLLWTLAVLVAIVVGLKVLPGGFPDGLVVNAARPFNAFGDWVIEHQRTNWLFVNALVPLRDGVKQAFDGLVTALSRMTWLGVVGAAGAIAGLLAGWRMAALSVAGFLVMGFLGLWPESLETLALVILSVVVALAIGIPIGVWTGRHAAVERFFRPVLDAMQTIPAFSYLVPLVLLFSIGVTTAMIATVIFALPPAIRLTSLGVRMVPESSLEVGRSFGSTSWQVLRKVQLPLAKPSIMLGVNQTIMMALGMVVIAASVGFGGLGGVVYKALQTLDVGEALGGGLAIVALAIILDRVTFAWSRRDRSRRGSNTIRLFGWAVGRGVGLLLALVAVVAAVVVGRQVLRQQDFPQSWAVSIATPVNTAVDWITRTFGDITSAMSNAMARLALNPLEHVLTNLPWWMVCGAAALIAWAVSRRWTLTALAFSCLAAVGVIGMWDDAMTTLTQVIVAVVSAVILAIPIGVWSATNDRVQRALKPVLDTMQTMPQFVYLVPVVALFNVGRVPAVIAALIYALPPGIRLTDLGIRQVPAETVEAAEAFGSTRTQLLTKVQLPLAKPSIMLGINQTIMMVLSVVIIGGLVGGGGLGYQVINGISHDPGTGMVAGIAILLLAIVIDRITQELGQPVRGRVARRRTIGWFGPARLRAGAGPHDVSEIPTMESGKGEE